MREAPLNVALVRARYTPFGGAERFVQRALGALGNQGAAVTVLARSWGGEATGDDPSHSVKVRWLRCNPFYLGSIWRDASFAAAVRRCLARESFDLVQSHERIPGLAIYRAGDGVHAAWLDRRATHMGFWARAGLALNPHHAYLKRVERRMFEHPDLRTVICNSLMVQEEIATRFRIDRTKLTLIPNGIDVQRFTPPRDLQARLSLRVELGIDAQAPVFVLVGSGFARKGVCCALAALAKARREAHLVVVGHDKHLQRYRNRAHALGIARRVHFVGAQRDTMPYYAMADAMLLPSVYDPFPNAVLEALACGLPAIVSDGCGATDVIVQGENGWVCPVADAIAFAAAMDALSLALRQPEVARALRNAARATAERFSLDALGSALIAFYRALGARTEAKVAQC